MANTKALLLITTVGFLAACSGTTTQQSSDNQAVAVGDQLQTVAGLNLTIERVYSNGSGVASFAASGLNGETFSSVIANSANDTGSNVVSETTDGNRKDIIIEATSEDGTYNQAGKRYMMTFSNGSSTDTAAFQFREDQNDPSRRHINLSAFGTDATNIPSGTFTYGAATDNRAFINIEGQTVQLPFVFTADLTSGTATLSADNGTHKITGGTISIDASTGKFNGTNAQIGENGSLRNANVSGGLFGANANGVAGMLYSTEAAIPSVTGGFVGTKDAGQ